MAGTIATAYVDVRAQTGGFKSGVERQAKASGARAGKSFSSAFRTAAKVGALLGAGALIGKGVGVLKDSVKAASNVGEQVNKVNRVFGKSAEGVRAFARDAATSLGQSREQALTAAGTFGNLLTSVGLTRKESAKMSTGFLTLAADLASFNNSSPEEALEAIRAGLVGETEPLKKFGVNLNEATIKQKALDAGLVTAKVSHERLAVAQIRANQAQQRYTEAVKEHGKGSKEAESARAAALSSESALNKVREGTIPTLNAQQKAQAAALLIQEQTKNAQGDFKKTSEGLANQTRILGANWDDAKAKLGKGLLPVVQDAVSFLNDHSAQLGEFAQTAGEAIGTGLGKAVELIQDAAPYVQEFAGSMLEVAEAIAPIAADAFGQIADAVETAAPFAKELAGGIGEVAGFLGGASIATGAAVFVTLATVLPRIAAAAAAIRAASAGAALTAMVSPITLIAASAAVAAAGIVKLAEGTKTLDEEATNAVEALQNLLDMQLGVEGAENRLARAHNGVEDAQKKLTSAQQHADNVGVKTERTLDKLADQQKRGIDTSKQRKKAIDANAEAQENLRRKELDLADAHHEVEEAESNLAGQTKLAGEAADETSKAWGQTASKALNEAQRAFVKAHGGASVLRGEMGGVKDSLNVGADAASRWATQLETTAGETEGLTAEAIDLIGEIAGIARETGKIPDQKTMDIIAKDLASGKIDAVRAKLDAMRDKTITLTTIQREIVNRIFTGGGGGNTPPVVAPNRSTKGVEGARDGDSYAKAFMASWRRVTSQFRKPLLEAILAAKDNLQGLASDLGSIVGDALDKRTSSLGGRSAAVRDKQDAAERDRRIKELQAQQRAGGTTDEEGVFTRFNADEARKVADELEVLHAEVADAADELTRRTVDGQKEAFDSYLREQTDALNRGLITSKQYNDNLKAELEKLGLDMGTIGAALGEATGRSFNDTLQALLAQSLASIGFGGPEMPGGPGVVTPARAETLLKERDAAVKALGRGVAGAGGSGARDKLLTANAALAAVEKSAKAKGGAGGATITAAEQAAIDTANRNVKAAEAAVKKQEDTIDRLDTLIDAVTNGNPFLITYAVQR